jgi:hypothetical protein
LTPRAKVNNGWKSGGLVSAVLSNTVSRYHLTPPAAERLSNASSFKRLSGDPDFRRLAGWRSRLPESSGLTIR